MGLLLLYLFGALSISFLCSILEAVLLSAPMSFVSMLEKKDARALPYSKIQAGHRQAHRGHIVAQHHFAHRGCCWCRRTERGHFRQPILCHNLGHTDIAHSRFSEIIPKTIGASYWRKMAIPCARIIHVLVIVTYPWC